MKIKVCAQCGNQFRKKSRRFCSRSCWDAFHDAGVMVVCKNCGKAFRTVKNRLQNGGGKFCSVACFNQAPRQGTKLPTKIPTKEEIAWAAGIYEGEGSAGGPGPTPEIRIPQKDHQKDQWVLRRLLQWFGGNIYAKYTEPGIHIWRVGGPRARNFINCIWPHLSPRRREQIRRKFRELPIEFS